METSAQPQRCSEHNLVVGSDGKCVLCRRAAAPPPRRSLIPVLALLIVAGFGATAFLIHRQRVASRQAKVQPQQVTVRPVAEPKPAPIPHASEPQLSLPEPENPLPPAQQAMLDAAIRKPILPRPTPPQQPPAEDPRAVRERIARRYQEAALRQAMSQVSIVVYVADW